MNEEYTNEEVEKIKKEATQDEKINRLLDDVNGIKDRLDNGISEKVFRNSWAIGIFGTIVTGLVIATLMGAV